MRILGLDEAGRGSVLGPLVVGAFAWELTSATALRDVLAQAPLRQAGADDSKLLRPKVRDRVRASLEALGQGRVLEISPARIDQGNLNQLEEECFVRLALELRPERIYLDAPCHPRAIPALVRRLEAALVAGGLPAPEMVVEPKADGTWPVVGAASIFAKTSRDAAIAALQQEADQDPGSGYPSDPVTRRFIQGFLTRGEPLPSCVRSRWGTIEALRQQSMF